jgi:hypothetical protein
MTTAADCKACAAQARAGEAWVRYDFTGLSALASQSDLRLMAIVVPSMTMLRELQ